jgi:hypothetical protein
MHRIVLSGSVLASLVCAALIAAQPTFADGQHDYADSVQENPAAFDIAHVWVSNGNDGTIDVTVGFRALFVLLPTDTDLVLLLDTDQNHATGDVNGAEYAVWNYGEDNTYEFLHWNGTGWDDAGQLSVRSVPILGISITLNRSQIGDVSAFDFAAATLRGPNDAPIMDVAPDNGTWTYQLVFTPVIASVVKEFRPVRPSAGHTFTANARVTLATGETVAATTVRCKAQLAGKPLHGAGAGGCSFRIPTDAKGKRLVVTLTAGYNDAKPTTSTEVFRVG